MFWVCAEVRARRPDSGLADVERALRTLDAVLHLGLPARRRVVERAVERDRRTRLASAELQLADAHAHGRVERLGPPRATWVVSVDAGDRPPAGVVGQLHAPATASSRASRRRASAPPRSALILSASLRTSHVRGRLGRASRPRTGPRASSWPTCRAPCPCPWRSTASRRSRARPAITNSGIAHGSM